MDDFGIYFGLQKIQIQWHCKSFLYKADIRIRCHVEACSEFLALDSFQMAIPFNPLEPTIFAVVNNCVDIMEYC